MTSLFDDLFAESASSGLGPEATPDRTTGRWKVIIADDEKDMHHVTRMALADIEFYGKKLEMISSYSGEETIELLKEHPDTAILLLDVVMETDDAGLMAVKTIREELGNRYVRIVLRTGQPGKAPEKDVILNYDINDYLSKSEITAQKLFTTVISSLRSYTNLAEVSQEVYYKIMDCAQEGIALIDAPTQTIIEINPAAQRMIGYPKEQLINRDCHDFFVCNDADGKLYTCHDPDRIIDHEERILISRSGRKVPIFLSSVPMELHGEKCFLITFLDISEVKDLQEQLKGLAYYDTLTKLANRTLFLETLKQQFENAVRHKEQIALLFIDLNKFKQVNDLHGHHIGDLLLAEVGARLAESVRKADTAARLGGDEFAAILNRISDKDEICTITERIIESIEKPVTLAGIICQVGASIGISIFPADSQDFEELLMKADTAMYTAKATGESCFRFAGESDN